MKRKRKKRRQKNKQQRVKPKYKIVEKGMKEIKKTGNHGGHREINISVFSEKYKRQKIQIIETEKEKTNLSSQRRGNEQMAGGFVLSVEKIYTVNYNERGKICLQLTNW